MALPKTKDTIAQGDFLVALTRDGAFGEIDGDQVHGIPLVNDLFPTQTAAATSILGAAREGRAGAAAKGDGGSAYRDRSR